MHNRLFDHLHKEPLKIQQFCYKKNVVKFHNLINEISLEWL